MYDIYCEYTCIALYPVQVSPRSFFAAMENSCEKSYEGRPTAQHYSKGMVETGIHVIGNEICAQAFTARVVQGSKFPVLSPLLSTMSFQTRKSSKGARRMNLIKL